MNIAYTLFEILDASRLRFRYRFLKVRESLPDDVRQPIRLQRWADELWRRRLHCPVFPLRHGKDAFFVIPADTALEGVDLSYVDVPYLTYHADPTDKYREVELSKASSRELELLARMLERPFSEKLSAMGGDFWRDTWTRFFRMQAENSSQSADLLNAFRGISFAVVPMPPGKVYLALDILTRYISRLSLAEYRTKNRESEVGEHCSVPFERRRWLLRDNGAAKYRCIYAGETGKSIGEFLIEDLGLTVLEYYEQKFPQIAEHLRPDEPAVFCARDKRDQDPVPVPASRLFPIFPFERDFRHRCSVRPQLSPDERQHALRQFIHELGTVRYANSQLQLSDRLLTAQDIYFAVPKLEFGHGFTLDNCGVKPRNGDYSVSSWGAEKMRSLIQAGPYFEEEYPPTALLYPESLDRRTREEFVRAVEQELSVCTGSASPKFAKQISYSADPHGHNLLVRTHELKREFGEHVLAICVLSRLFEDHVHNHFKAECEDVCSQCVKEENIREVTLRRSKGRNFALGIMMALGFKPWVLASSLNVDLHIGLDVLVDQVAYTFLYGQGGRNIFRDRGHSGGNELIKTRLLREKLISGLTRIHSAGARLNSFVIHRDGRWWPKETDALEEAVSFLKGPGQGILPTNIRYAVAEIRKSHFPIRIFSTKYKDGKPTFRNPFPGCYLVLDENRAVLTSTGRPSEWDEQGRTAGTILVQLAHNPGAFQIGDVARDVFFLTQLNWSAPDIEINAPVTIRWADDMLRDLYIEPDR